MEPRSRSCSSETGSGFLPSNEEDIGSVDIHPPPGQDPMLLVTGHELIVVFMQIRTVRMYLGSCRSSFAPPKAQSSRASIQSRVRANLWKLS
jgi:hypothetical protein